MSELTDNVQFSANAAPAVIQGVLSGFIIMAVPLTLIGVAVGLGQLLIRTPIKVLGGVK